jgi:hypothetical protein
MDSLGVETAVVKSHRTEKMDVSKSDVEVVKYCRWENWIEVVLDLGGVLTIIDSRIDIIKTTRVRQLNVL